MTIVKRTTKGSALTYAEMDENFRDLDSDMTLDRVLKNDDSSNRSITLGSTAILTTPNFSTDSAYITNLTYVTRTANSYQPGEILEELHSACNGTSLRGRATMTNVTAGQALTTSYAVATGSAITNYTPPVGTTVVVYEYIFHVDYVDVGGLSNWRFYYSINGTDYTEAVSFRRSLFSYYAGDTVIYRIPIILGASTGVANDAILTDVRPTLHFKWEAREYSATNEQTLHTTTFWEGASNQQFSRPSVMIKAIV